MSTKRRPSDFYFEAILEEEISCTNEPVVTHFPPPNGEHLLSPILHTPTSAKHFPFEGTVDETNVVRSPNTASKKIQRCLETLKPNESADAIYLKCVAEGRLHELERLFQLQGTPAKFDRNCKNSKEKSALRIAIENKKNAVIKLLLDYNVAVDDNLFHAIDLDNIEAVEILVEKRPRYCEAFVVKEDNKSFEKGMTAFTLAAIRNKYQILKLLHSKGHRLPDIEKRHPNRTQIFEKANLQNLIERCLCSPAYITLLCETEGINPISYCMERIDSLTEYRDRWTWRYFAENYNELIKQVEKYLCMLLDEISSTEELAAVFTFRFGKSDSNSSQKHSSTRRNTLKCLETAAGQQLKQFVAHPRSQLAVSYLKSLDLPIIMQENSYLSLPLLALLSLTYPVLVILYLCAPNTKLGQLIMNPVISATCHFASDVYFIILVVIYLTTKSDKIDYVGAPPTAIEMVILVWIFSNFAEEIQEIIIRGVNNYFTDPWKYIDILTLFLFFTGIFFRVFEYILNMSSAEKSSRIVRECTEACFAAAYIFVILRIVARMRIFRIIGPLIISLIRMMWNVLCFLSLFVLIHLGFSLAMLQIYWYYSTPSGKYKMCKIESKCWKAKFSTFYSTTRTLFWAIFNLMDLKGAEVATTNSITQYVGMWFLAAYHVIMILVLINMIIAMMTKTFEDTSEHEDREWKFIRTSVWIKFIRREITRPPPMNLIPNPFAIYLYCKRLHEYRRYNQVKYQDDVERYALLKKKLNNNKTFSNRRKDTIDVKVKKFGLGSQKSSLLRVTRTLVKRYAHKYLMKSSEGQHHHNGL